MATWTTLNNADFDMTDPDNWTVDSTVLAAVNVYEWTTPSGHIYRLSGTGFTYSDGMPTGGNVTDLTIQLGATQVASVTSGGGTFADAGDLFADNMANFFQALLPDASTYEGGEGNEAFLSTPGSDTFNAHGGDDTFVWHGRGEGEYLDPEVDIFRGGDGYDTLRVAPAGDTFALYGDGNVVHYQDRNNPDARDRVVARDIEAVHVQADEPSWTSIAGGLGGLVDEVKLDLSEGHDVVSAPLTDISLTVNAGGGTDFIHTGRMNDVINAGAGNDVIDGHGGTDLINAGDGHDQIFWNEIGIDGPEGGNDTINAGTGFDTVSLHYADAPINVTIQNDGAGGTIANRQAGDDVALRNVERLIIKSGDGADRVTIEDLTGTAHENGLISMELGGGNDVLDAAASLRGVHFKGESGNDVATGGAGIDLLNGGRGDDILNGGGGDDILRGEADDDTLNGGAGDDDLKGGAGADAMDGGAGVDTVSYDGSDTFVVANLLGGFGLFGHAHGDTLANIENVIGSRHDDTVFGNLGDNVLEGRDGNDWLYGDDGRDTLIGGRGDDIGQGGAGDDTFVYKDGLDSYNGGVGSDTASFQDFQHAVSADLTSAGTEVWTRDGADLTTGTWREIANLASVENVTGTDGSDSFAGDGQDNTYGYVGSSGGGGLDTVNGRGGSDTADFSAFDSAVWADLTYAGTEAWTRDGADLAAGAWREIADLASVENVTGTDGSDSFAGDGQDNTYGYVGSSGGGGFDKFNGRGGSDMADFSAFDSAVWVNLTYAGTEAWTRDGADLVTGAWREIADLDSVENVTGTDGSDTIVGNAQDNTYGYVGSSGGGGLDTIDGRGGSDTADFSAFDSAVWVNLTYAGTEAWTRDGADLAAGTWREIADLDSVENVIGTVGSDTFFGDGQDNTFSYVGSSGGGGLDTIDGRGGSDTVDFSAFDSGVAVFLSDPVHQAWALDGAFRDLATLDSVENVTGSVFGDFLAGDGAANGFKGLGGDDTFIYRGGLDTYDGGAGSDTADFGDFDSAVWVDLTYAGTEAWTRDGADLATGTWRAIADLDSVENLEGSQFADRLVGDDAANRFIGRGGDDTLTGGGGSDTFGYYFSGFGDDVITDFEAGAGAGDVIELDVLGFIDFTDVTDAATQVGADLVIDFGAIGSITLAGVNHASLDVNDFSFVS